MRLVLSKSKNSFRLNCCYYYYDVNSNMALFQSLMWALPALLQNHLLLIKNAQTAIL